MRKNENKNEQLSDMVCGKSDTAQVSSGQLLLNEWLKKSVLEQILWKNSSLGTSLSTEMPLVFKRKASFLNHPTLRGKSGNCSELFRAVKCSV